MSNGCQALFTIQALTPYFLDQLEAVFLNFINEGFDGSEHLGSEGFGLDTVINLCSQTHED